MLGIGELVLLLLIFIFAGGALSKLARWALFRRAPGGKQVLSFLADRVKERMDTPPRSPPDTQQPTAPVQDPDSEPPTPDS